MTPKALNQLLDELRTIVADRESTAREIYNLKRRVKELTRQRDEAIARTAEMRAYATRYQRAAATAATTPTAPAGR